MSTGEILIGGFAETDAGIEPDALARDPALLRAPPALRQKFRYRVDHVACVLRIVLIVHCYDRHVELRGDVE